MASSLIFDKNTVSLTLLAALLAGCPDDKSTSDDEGTTDTTAATHQPTTDTPTTDGQDTTGPSTSAPSDGEGTDSTAATTDTSTTGAPPPAACETGTATSDFKIDWGVDLPPCDTEVCQVKRDSPCIVSAIIFKEGPTLIELECNNPETGPATDTVDIFPEPGGTIDLAVGTAVQVVYESQRHDEVGASERLRITDDRGLVLATGRDRIFSFPDDDTQWAAKFLADLASPLAASFVGCTGDPASHGIQVTQDAASVIVGNGGAATLTADASWLVVVEFASFDGQLDLTILRVVP